MANLTKSSPKQDPFVVFINKLMAKITSISVKALRFSLQAFQKDYWSHHHLIATLKDWKLSISWVDHKSYAKEKEIYFNKLKTKLKPENFVKRVFAECKKCNFIIFNFGKKGNIFLQYWLGDNKILLDYPMVKGNHLGKYKYQVLGLLVEHKLYRIYDYSKDVLEKKYPSGFILGKFEEGEKISVNFHRRYDKAAEFTLKVIQDFFKKDFKDVELIVG